MWIFLYLIYLIHVKILLNYTNLFSPNAYEKNDKNIFNNLKDEKLYFAICGKNRKFEKP